MLSGFIFSRSHALRYVTPIKLMTAYFQRLECKVGLAVLRG